MRLRNTIITLLVLAIIGGVAVYVSYQPKPGEKIKLLTVDASEIKRIDFRYPGREIEVERAGTGWKITKPVTGGADKMTIEGILNSITGLKPTSTVEETPEHLARYGLAKPTATVTVTTAGNKVLPAIMVGRNTPIGDSTYVKMADKPAVMLVSSSFSSQVNKTVDELRTHSVVSLKPSEVDRVVIQHSGNSPTIELTKQKGEWLITKPQHYIADAHAVSQLLSALQDAQIVHFVKDEPKDLSKYGLATPSLKVELYGANKERNELAFGYDVPEADANAIYVRRGGKDEPVSTVGNYLFKEIDLPLLNLRDRTIVTFDQKAVRKVVIKSGATSLVAQATADGKWNGTIGSKTKPVEAPVVKSLLQQLHDFKGSKIVEDPMTDPASFGMVNPTFDITLYGKDGKSIAAVKLAEIQHTVQVQRGYKTVSQKKVTEYATSSANTAVFELAPTPVRYLETTISRLRGDVIPPPSPKPSPGPKPVAAPSASPSATPSPAAS